MQKKNSFLIMLFVLGIGLITFCFNVIGFKLLYFPGDLGDGRLVMYFLEHAHKFFIGDVSSFWNAPFMFPEKDIVSYSENMVGSAPIYSLFRIIGFDAFRSYQLWFVVVSALNFITAFYFLKYVFKDNYAALLGAFVFAFSIAIQSQLTHAQTFPRFAIPLAFMMAVKFSEGLKPKYFFFTLLFVVYQIYCGIYLGFMLAIPVGIYLVLILIRDVFFEKKDVFNLKWFLQIAAYGILNIFLILPLMLPYMARKISPGFEHFKQIFHSIPTVKSHFFSQEGSLIWDFLSKIGQNHPAWWDHQIFAGGIATLALIIGILYLIYCIIKTKFRLSSLSTPLLLIFTGLITFFLYLRFSDISAYIFVYFLPGFSSMRSVTRIINIELIFFAIATAFVFSKIFEYNFKYKPLFFIVALVLIVSDNYFYANRSYKTKVSIAKERTEKIEDAFAQIPDGSVVSYEPENLESASIYYQIDAMLTAQKYNLIAVNGYTATCPGDYGMYWNGPNEKSRNYWLSNKQIGHDTLYIVKGSDAVEKISVEELQNDFKVAQEEKLENLINYIKSNEKWMSDVEKRALENNIPLDSMIIMEAKWVIKHEN
jgi:hypothetical protein